VVEVDGGRGGGDDTMLGESVKIEFSNAAASRVMEEGHHGSRLDPQHKTPSSSVKAEYPF